MDLASLASTVALAEGEKKAAEERESDVRSRLEAGCEVSFADRFLGDDGCELVARLLPSSAHVTSLDLRGNHIRERGVECLARSLAPGGSALRHLSLEWNLVGASDGGLRALCASLGGNTSLLHLDLRNNRIGANGARYIAAMLRKNKTMTSLGAHTRAHPHPLPLTAPRATARSSLERHRRGRRAHARGGARGQ